MNHKEASLNTIQKRPVGVPAVDEDVAGVGFIGFGVKLSFQSEAPDKHRAIKFRVASRCCIGFKL